MKCFWILFLQSARTNPLRYNPVGYSGRASRRSFGSLPAVAKAMAGCRRASGLFIGIFCTFNCFAMIDVNTELSEMVKTYVNVAKDYSTHSRTKKSTEKKEQKERVKKIKKLVIDSDAVVSSEILELAKNTPNLKNALQDSVKKRARAQNQPFIDFSHGLDRIAQKK